MWVTVFTVRSGDARALAVATNTKTAERHMDAHPQGGQKHTPHPGPWESSEMGKATHEGCGGSPLLRVLISIRKNSGAATEGVLRKARPMSVLILILCAGFGSTTLKAADGPNRQVAITIDDLPAGAANSMTASAIAEMTAKLLGTLRDQNVPAVGFVNERKLYKLGEVDARIGALRMWLDYGFELGNHTFSHASLNRVGLTTWEAEVVQGESVTRLLLAEHKMRLRYFRHPYLDTGRDLKTRSDAEAFLTQRGYRIAPVTLDAWD